MNLLINVISYNFNKKMPIILTSNYFIKNLKRKLNKENIFKIFPFKLTQ